MKSLALLVVSCVMSASVMAAVKCPSVASIVREGLDRVEKNFPSEQQPWVGIKDSKFNTKQEWRLFVFGFGDDATTEANAKQKALEKLNYLKKFYGPVEMPSGEPGTLYCHYYSPDNDHRIFAGTLTPPQDLPRTRLY